MRAEFEKRMDTDYTSGADVLFVCDTRSFYHTASLRGTDPVSNAAIDHVYLAILRSGVACDPVHINDLPRIDLTPYRTIVFGNVFVLSKDQRDFVTTHVARNGRTLVWFYAPGFSDAKTLDASHMSELTGMGIAPVQSPGTPHITFTLPGDSTRSLTLGNTPIFPLFCIRDSSAERFGYFSNTDQVALARKSTSACTSWYIGLPGKEVEPLRSILRTSGAHVYVSGGEIVYAGGGMLAVHTKEGGPHRITLRNGKERVLDLPEGAATLILDAETGESILK